MTTIKSYTLVLVLLDKGWMETELELLLLLYYCAQFRGISIVAWGGAGDYFSKKAWRTPLSLKWMVVVLRSVWGS